jgi:hypothetical protein
MGLRQVTFRGNPPIERVRPPKVYHLFGKYEVRDVYFASCNSFTTIRIDHPYIEFKEIADLHSSQLCKKCFKALMIED